jgi:hypothetical protein
MASRQEPNRPEEHFNNAMVKLAPRAPRPKMVVRRRSNPAQWSPDWTSNGIDLIAVIANLLPVPFVSTITTADLVAAIPKIMQA